MKQTAVEWYNAKLNAIDFKLNSGLINYEQCKVEMSEAFEQAKEMEKEIIRTAYLDGMDGEYNTSEQYYNKTFKSE
jgi:hypothetical protein